MLLAIIMAAIGMGQAQLAFPDVTKAKAATERVFSVIDRTPAIDAADPSGACPALGHMPALVCQLLVPQPQHHQFINISNDSPYQPLT